LNAATLWSVILSTIAFRPSGRTCVCAADERGVHIPQSTATRVGPYRNNDDSVKMIWRDY